MCGQFRRGADHELVYDFAFVFGTQAQRLAELHVQVLGRKAHVVAHADGDGALGLFGFCGDAPGFLLFDHGASGLVVVFVHLAMGVGQQGQAQHGGGAQQLLKLVTACGVHG